MLLFSDESEALTHAYLARAWAEAWRRFARADAWAGEEGCYDGHVLIGSSVSPLSLRPRFLRRENQRR